MKILLYEDKDLLPIDPKVISKIFSKWTSSKYNTIKKPQAITQTMYILHKGEGNKKFNPGTFTGIGTKWEDDPGHDYIVDGPTRTITVLNSENNKQVLATYYFEAPIGEIHLPSNIKWKSGKSKLGPTLEFRYKFLTFNITDLRSKGKKFGWSIKEGLFDYLVQGNSDTLENAKRDIMEAWNKIKKSTKHESTYTPFFNLKEKDYTPLYKRYPVDTHHDWFPFANFTTGMKTYAGGGMSRKFGDYTPEEVDQNLGIWLDKQLNVMVEINEIQNGKLAIIKEVKGQIVVEGLKKPQRKKYYYLVCDSLLKYPINLGESAKLFIDDKTKNIRITTEKSSSPFYRLMEKSFTNDLIYSQDHKYFKINLKKDQLITVRH